MTRPITVLTLLTKYDNSPIATSTPIPAATLNPRPEVKSMP
jgi:hypothetical protein